jgi:hypothetical protein
MTMRIDPPEDNGERKPWGKRRRPIKLYLTEADHRTLILAARKELRPLHQFIKFYALARAAHVLRPPS